MKFINSQVFVPAIILTGLMVVSSCNKDEDTEETTTTTSSTGTTTPVSAFDEFNTSAVTISFNNDEVTLVSNGLPNHTSPYWENTNALYISPVVATVAQMSPGTISSQSYTLTVPTAPGLASSSSATGLGAIGLAVSGAPIFNDQEGPSVQLTAAVASGFDYAGAHMGPTGYHYHLESSDIAENTALSSDDEALVGIMQDGFLLYGRKCNSTGDYPADLDVSGGHTSTSQHSSNGESFYHYHIINQYYIGSYIVLFDSDLMGTPNSF